MNKYRKALLIFLCFLAFFKLTVQAEENEEIPVIKNIYEIERAGPYYVELYTEHNGHVERKHVLINVTLEKTVLSEEFKEAIDASDFFVEEDRVLELNHEALIQLADAHAWDTETGRAVVVVVSDIQKNDNLENSYFITFATLNGTSTTINAYEGVSQVSNMEVSYRAESGSIGYKKYAVIIQQIGILFLLPIVILFFIYLITQSKLNKTVRVLYRQD